MKNYKKILLLIAVDVLAFVLISLVILTYVFNWFGVHAEEQTTVLARPTATATLEPTPTEYPSATPDPNTTENPADIATPQSSATPTPTPTPSGLCGGRYPDKFSYDGIISTDTRYASENVDIEVTYYEVDGVMYQIADIYIQNIDSFLTKSTRSNSEKAMTPTMAKSVNALLAINGDMSINSRDHGWIVRNGEELPRKYLAADICILYWDGVMETYDYKNDAIDYDAIYAKGPYQVWYFGPELMENDGSVKTKFNYIKDNFSGPNPRTVVGYYEPGHYAFIVVEGARDGSKSLGLSMVDLSQLCVDLGMTCAYNLDGGGSATMYFNGNVFGHNTRSTSDILYIIDTPAQ
ncbi:MAG: phosphodiester glycosidase family protein [Eubacteriales bacterium]|nr:phosphodiester glycosidase family protein [Eubacteriales bacterium]